MWNSLTGDVMSCFCLQVLQYNVETGTWTQIGTLQRTRVNHAIAEVNLDAVCRPVGNLNPVKQENKIINIIITKEFSFPIYLNWQLVILIQLKSENKQVIIIITKTSILETPASQSTVILI